jgi:DNA-binding CsgD family transcriptional regulator
MGTNHSSSVLDIADSFYAAALGEHPWDAAYGKLRAFTGARAVAMVSKDAVTGAPVAMAAAVDDGAWHAELMRQYHEEYRQHDPLTAFALHWNTGRWFDDQKDFDTETRNHGVFYQEFYRPLGIKHWTGFMVRHDETSLDFVSIMDGSTRAKSRDLQRPLCQIRMHIDRAMQIRRRLDAETGVHAAITELAIETLGTAVILLDESRRILHVNLAGKNLLASEPAALKVSGGRLIPSGCLQADQWLRACSMGGLRVQTASGEQLFLELTPVPPHARLARHYQRPLTLLTSRPRKSASSAPTERLALHYGLTEAERALCDLLAIRGLAPKECALKRSVSEATVRAQIKSIQQKTHTRTLAQLVRLVWMQ